jgi:hypothetical protein
MQEGHAVVDGDDDGEAHGDGMVMNGNDGNEWK